MAAKAEGAKDVPFETHKGTLGWAVVGLGMGRWHADSITRASGLELVALCDTDRERLERHGADFEGVALHDSMDELLADGNVQGVSLVLPHNMHAECAIRCIEAGRHVIVDKPFCLTVEEGRRMIAAARENGRLLSAWLNRRWDGDYVAIQKLVDAGKIGRVRYVENRVIGTGRTRPGSWRADRKSMGGLLFDWGVHCTDQVLMLMKTRPVDVVAFAQHDQPVEEGRDVEDRAQVQIRFEDGGVAVVGWELNSPAPGLRFLIEGESGGIRLDGKSGEHEKLFLYARKSKKSGELLERHQIVESQVPLAETDWDACYRNVARALAGEEPLIVTPESALKHVAVIEAAYASARTGKVVPVARDVF